MAPSIRKSALAGLALLFGTAIASGRFGRATAAQRRGTCPRFNGTFVIDNFRLYPENLDFDSNECKVYFGSNFNATVLVYDPYTKTQEIIDFPGITNTSPYHLSGIDFDPNTGLIDFVVSDGNVFVTNGANLTQGTLAGDNFIIRYNPKTKETIYKADTAAFIQGVKTQTGLVGNGIQDIAQDLAGNTYTYTTFGAKALARISPKGVVSTWFSTKVIGGTPNQFFPGIFGGIIFHAPSKKIVITDSVTGQFNTFDSTAAQGVLTVVNTTGFTTAYPGVSCDGLLNPSRYEGQNVLLCSEDGIPGGGAITVFTTSDNWKSAKFVGQVANNDPLASGSIPSATVQIANSLYISPFFATDTPIEDTAGTRASFPFIDITAKVDALVLAAGAKVAKEFA